MQLFSVNLHRRTQSGSFSDSTASVPPSPGLGGVTSSSATGGAKSNHVIQESGDFGGSVKNGEKSATTNSNFNCGDVTEMASDVFVVAMGMDSNGGTPSKRTPNAGLFYLSFLPDLLLTFGVGLGWYTRWNSFGYTFLFRYSVLSTLGAAGVLVFVGHFLLSYYCRSNILGAVAYLWYGCLLGVISLLDMSPSLMHQYSNLEDMSNLFLVSALICQAVVELVMKCCRVSCLRQQHNLWSIYDTAQVVGGSIACVMVLGSNATPVLVLLAALVLILTAIKLGSFLSLLNFAFLLASAEHYLFPDLHISVNPFGILCFLGRLSVGPMLDLILSGQTRLERWQGFITSSRCYQRLTFAFLAAVEVAFFAINASVVKNHKEWYVVVPFFVMISVLWLLMHLVFLMIFGTLITRFARSRDHLGAITGLLSLKKVLTARGLRYFSLTAYKLMYVCILSSLVTGFLTWTIRTPYSHSLMALVVAMETAIMELLNEFSSSLGGTCIGYGVVAPVASVRSDGMVTVLPPNFIQESGNRSTQTLQAVVDFFNHHMITNFGCDWSMGGVGQGDLGKKLGDFLSQRTVEGPRYDTYLLYYSGPTTAAGDWALTGGASMSLEDILSVWREHNDGFGSRLLLICDCEHSHQWVKPVWRLRPPDNLYVGLQTATFTRKKSNPDLPLSVGEFTRLWVDYNAGGVGNKNVFEGSSRSLKAVYAVSRRWTDFHFHLPNSEEIRSYWLQTLPAVTHTCLGLVITVLSTGIPLNCCECCSRLIRRLRMKIWPPAELDTGHGFKLIRL